MTVDVSGIKTETSDEIEQEVVGQCWSCEDDILEDSEYSTFTEWGDTYPGDHWVCDSCQLEQQFCDSCETFTDEVSQFLNERENRCYRCLVEHGALCEFCGEWRRRYDFPFVFEYGCEDCYSCECGDYDCSYCYPDGPPSEYSEWVHDYSYKPDPNFWSVAKDDEQLFGKPRWSPNPLPNMPYLGMELEIDINDVDDGANLVTNHNPRLIYCKEDSSISGFEMVTHPMTLEAAKELLPFEHLRTLRNQYSASAYNNGIHVHVSRDGFTNDVHVYRWMKLFYRNDDDVKRIARRDSSQWASFKNDSRNSQLATAKKQRGKKRKTGRTVQTYSERYSAINVNNTDTFEVRVFRGSLRKDEILAALELVAGSVEYTRQLTTVDIMRHNGWGWDSFILWAKEQNSTYENLIALDERTQGERPKEQPANGKPLPVMPIWSVHPGHSGLVRPFTYTSEAITHAINGISTELFIPNVNLRDANLQGADLHNADLQGANLRDANLHNANLRYANLRYANLRDANLQGADLHNANLQGADLHNADLQGANLRDVVSNNFTIWPDGYRPEQHTNNEVIADRTEEMEEVF